MKVRRLCLGLLFVLSLVAISSYGGVISYGFFYAVVLIPALSLIYLLYVFLRFRVHQEIKTRNIIAGEAVPYSFILKNEGLTVFTSVAVKIYADFSFVEKVPDNQEFRLFPGERLEFRTRLTCKYRGEYKVGVNKIIITDFFGLFSLEYWMRSNIEALVKPRIIKLSTLASVPELEVFMQSQAAREKEEADLTVREYIRGDALKKIHWKSTAKSGSLKVRNDIGTLKQKIMLLADFEKISDNIVSYLPVENKILEVTIALLYHFVLQNMEAELWWRSAGTERRVLTEINTFSRIYEELAAVYFQKEKNFTEFCQEMGQKGVLSESTILFMVVQKVDEALFTQINELVSAGKIVIVYVVTNEDITEYVRQSGIRMKITAIRPEEEIEGII